MTLYVRQKKRHRCKEQTLDSVGEGEGGMIWENSIETCILSYVKWIASPGSMHETGCSGLVHWDDPEGWGGEGGGRGVQDGEHMYTRGGFMSAYGKSHYNWSLQFKKKKRISLQCRRPGFWSLGWEVPLEEGMATHSSILAWRITWTEEPARLQSMGSQRVRHDWATFTHSRRIGWKCIKAFPQNRLLKFEFEKSKELVFLLNSISGNRSWEITYVSLNFSMKAWISKSILIKDHLC